jgi:hypothetical protein
MLSPKDNTFNARVQRNTADDTVIIDAGSLVVDNNWIDYTGVLFNIKEYLRSTITDQRLKFFNNINYAVYLVLAIDVTGSLQVIEGTQVYYTTLDSVPIPPVFEAVPVVGIVLIQDGTTNVIDGIKPVGDNNVIFYSGMGNVLDKNIKGVVGVSSQLLGDTGLQGKTGIIGIDGLTGIRGFSGDTGTAGYGVTGLQGPQGLTGINWDIEVLFNILL